MPTALSLLKGPRGASLTREIDIDNNTEMGADWPETLRDTTPNKAGGKGTVR